MKKAYLLFIAILIGWNSFGQGLNTQPRVLFAVHNFYHPEKANYIELYLSFDASSLSQIDMGDYHQSQLEILYVIKLGGKIYKYDKFQVLGPEMAVKGTFQDFIDVQQMTLKPGDYTIDLSITDMGNPENPVKAQHEVSVTMDGRKVEFSDILFEKKVVEAKVDGPLVKNGLEMTPWLVSTVPAFLDYVYLYTEVYNSDYALGANGAYVEKHTLKNLDADSIFPQYSVIKKTKAAEANVILKKLDLTSLPMGPYVYTIELFDRNNKLVASNGKHFYRESEVPSLKRIYITASAASFEQLVQQQTNRDTIVDFFRCIRPLGDYQHTNFIDQNWKNSSSDVLKSYVTSFWLKYKPENPTQEWLKYRATVRLVNEEYGTRIKKGYDTDMGMTYLKYGPPDQMVNRENEPSSYPYIIWQYYKHPLTSNAMYVFYDPSLISRDYELLHTNVRGEKNNERWKLILQSRNNPNADIDQEKGVDHWGGRADEYYENPR